MLDNKKEKEIRDAVANSPEVQEIDKALKKAKGTLGVVAGGLVPSAQKSKAPLKIDQEADKQKRIKKALDAAAKILEAEGAKFFLSAIDVQPKSPDGGKAYVQSDIKGQEFCYVLDLAFPTGQDLINLGIYVGQLIQARSKNNAPVTLKGN